MQTKAIWADGAGLGKQPVVGNRIYAHSIRRGGVRSLAVSVNGQYLLLDGHNRHKICKKHGLKFETKEEKIPDRDHAVL
jgi:hypothetical protein